MTAPARRVATYQDILDAPEHLVAELVDGELYLSPRPAKAHAATTSALGEELGPPFKRGRGGPGGWIILDEPEIHFGSQVVVPDLAGWRRERMPVITTEEAHFTLAPDWLCEVLSPRTSRLDRLKKLPLYAREGVSYVWLVDPLECTLEVRKLQGEQWLVLGTYADDQKVRAVPFDAIELDLSILWADVQR